MIMTLMMMNTISIINVNTQPMHTPKFLQTLQLFQRVTFAAGVQHKLFKAQNFAMVAETRSR